MANWFVINKRHSFPPIQRSPSEFGDSPPASIHKPGAADANIASRKIFVGGLIYGVTGAHLKAHFEKFAPVQEAFIANTNAVGYVVFKFVTGVKAAFAGQPHYICNSRVDIREFDPHRSRQSSKR